MGINDIMAMMRIVIASGCGVASDKLKDKKIKKPPPSIPKPKKRPIN